MADRPDLDLTGAAISSTFQHLLQIREDDKTLYDALGNHLDDFRLSGSFTTSEFLEIEDGQGVSGNKLHSRGGVLYWGGTNLETGGSGLSNLVEDTTPELGGDLNLNSKEVTGAGNFLINGSGSFTEINLGATTNTLSAYMNIEPASVTKDLFLIKSGSFSALNVNQDGVMNLGGFTAEPSVVEGGFYYNTNDNEFYLGL